MPHHHRPVCRRACPRPAYDPCGRRTRSRSLLGVFLYGPGCTRCFIGFPRDLYSVFSASLRPGSPELESIVPGNPQVAPAPDSWVRQRWGVMPTIHADHSHNRHTRLQNNRTSSRTRRPLGHDRHVHRATMWVTGLDSKV